MADGDDRFRRIEALGTMLRHHDASQLWFQLAEIAGDQTYLRHGVAVHEGDVVLDVGANVGVAAAFFASQCGAGVVHCFEPVAPLCELLKENLAQLPACIAHEYGLSSTAGRAEITYYPRSAAMSGLYADPDRDRAQVATVLMNLGLSAEEAAERLEHRYESQTLTCELRTLSAVLREQCLEHVDLLKIDVERAELDVLRGIELRDWPSIGQVVIEVHDEDRGCAVIDSELRSHGFQVTVEQAPEMRGTAIRMLYATRG